MSRSSICEFSDCTKMILGSRLVLGIGDKGLQEKLPSQDNLTEVEMCRSSWSDENRSKNCPRYWQKLIN